MTNEQFNIIGHTLGIDVYNSKLSNNKKYKVLPDEFYRNYYNYGTLSMDIQELVNSGDIELYMRYDMNYFHVTNIGIRRFREKFFNEITMTFKPLSKSKQRYQSYLDCDCGLTYSEFCGIKLPKLEYASWPQSGIRFISTKYPKVKGEYCKYKFEAKASYKSKLKEYLSIKHTYRLS